MAAASRLVFGAMSGTSIDGVDVAAVRVHGRGLEMRAEPLGMESGQFEPTGLADALRGVQRGGAVSALRVAELARNIGLTYARVAQRLVERVGRPDLIVAHGQTLAHAPPLSLQLIDPFPISQLLGCTVVSGLRGADLAAGGQGAPITPLADWILYRSPDAARVIINLGGFANATVLPRNGTPDALGQIQGFDICLCSQLLDHAARLALGKPFDRDGAAANSARPDERLVAALRAPLEAQAKSGRSLGTADECVEIIDQHRAGTSAAVLLASACSAIGNVIERSIATRSPTAAQWIVAGGSAANRALVAAIGHGATLSDQVGIPIQAREAVEMAVLGALAQDGVSITLAAVTGARSAAPTGLWTGATTTRLPGAVAGAIPN